MKRKPFNALGREVSELGFGGSSLGGVFGPVDDEEAIRSVHAALAAGIDVFDVAPFYGLGRAEALLGRALSGLPRDRYVLTTKVGRYGEREFDFSAARVRASVDESCARLGVEHLDVVYAHDIEYGEPAQIREETLPALRALAAEGRIGAVGVSGHPLAVLRAALESSGPIDVVLSYGHYHLFDVSCDELELGSASLVAASPLAMGLLTDAGPPAWHPAAKSLRSACADLAKHAATLGIDLASVALRFALGNARASTTLVGMRTVAEVERNTAACGNAPDLDALAPLLEPLRGATWDARPC